VRFLQASRHGEVLTPIEFVEEKKNELGSHVEGILHRLHQGEPLGEALVAEKVGKEIRLTLLSEFISKDLAPALDQHYIELAAHREKDMSASLTKIAEALEHVREKRVLSQWIGGLSFVPFVGLLVAHAINHQIPLFLASFAGFVIALTGISAIPKMRKLAIREAVHEYREYLFLFPLFLSITLLQKSGFFAQMSVWLHAGIESLGAGMMAFIQFTGACFLSALLDNNVVADFAARAIKGVEIGTLHLFFDGTDRRLCGRRLLDAYRLGAVRGGLCLHPQGGRQRFFTHPLDEGHDARDFADLRFDGGCRVCRVAFRGLNVFENK
jgi:hypothetical protein